MDSGSDLVPLTLFDAHEMTCRNFAKKMNDRVSKARKKEDKQHNLTTQSALFLPPYIVQIFIFAASYLNMMLGFAIPVLGVYERVGGHCIITNIGSLNIQKGMAPLSLRAELFVAVGSTNDTPFVVDDKVVSQKVVNCGFTCDHRYMNPQIVAEFINHFRSVMEDPAQILQK